MQKGSYFVILKQPLCVDISHWKTVSDFSKISPRPLLMFTKATEGSANVDPTFVEYFEGMKSTGIARGAYHFFRRVYDAAQQARHFVDTIKPHVTVDDILVLDVEEGGETATQLWQWFFEARAAFPNNQFMLYSRKNILDPIQMTPAPNRIVGFGGQPSPANFTLAYNVFWIVATTPLFANSGNFTHHHNIFFISPSTQLGFTPDVTDIVVNLSEYDEAKMTILMDAQNLLSEINAEIAVKQTESTAAAAVLAAQQAQAAAEAEVVLYQQAQLKCQEIIDLLTA